MKYKSYCSVLNHPIYSTIQYVDDNRDYVKREAGFTLK